MEKSDEKDKHGQSAVKGFGGTSCGCALRSSRDPLANVRECCRASVAVEKALGEAVRDALAAGRSWAEVGQALGIDADTSVGVKEHYDSSRRWMRARFWGMDQV